MTEQEREDKLHAWFDMWLRQTDDGILELFVPDAVYVESWGPEYHGVDAIRHWFMEWNTRGRVLTWDIKQFFHKENQTVVEWYFKNAMNDGRVEEFDGLSGSRSLAAIWTVMTPMPMARSPSSGTSGRRGSDRRPSDMTVRRTAR